MHSRRKKGNKVYIRKNKSQNLLQSKTRAYTQRRSSASQRLPLRSSTSSIRPSATLRSSLGRLFADFGGSESSSLELRKRLQRVAGANAVLSWVLSVLGYLDVKDRNEAQEVNTWVRDLIRGLICGISMVQIILIVLYSASLLQYLESVRVTLRLSPIPVPALRYSSEAILNCFAECAFHMLVVPPRLHIQGEIYQKGTYSLLSLNDFLYVLLLMRNYHSLQFLFWSSGFSTARVHFFTHVADMTFSNLFVLRCYLAAYSLKLVLGAYTVILVISGLCIFTFEKGSEEPSFAYVENGLWIAAITQSTVGFGDFFPTTYFGEAMTIASCFVGNFVLSIIISLSNTTMNLNLTECTLYSEIVYAKKKRHYARESALIIQRWWRLMKMRMMREIKGQTVVEFYSQLRKYREVISTCQRVKDRRFERQIDAFRSSTTQEFRRISEYLQPILTAESLVLSTQTRDILRGQYQLKVKTKEILSRFRHRSKKNILSLSSLPIGITPSPSPSPEPFLHKGGTSITGRSDSKYRVRVTPSPRTGIKELAKAKIKAHQKLIGRLLKEDMSVHTSVVSSRSVSPQPASMEM